MNIIFKVFLTMTAIYVLFHIVDVFDWWYKKAKAVVKGIYDLIKNVFGK